MTISPLSTSPASLAGSSSWYTVLSKPWLAALGETPDSLKARRAVIAGTVHMWLPFALSFVADIVMAWMLAGVLGHLGPGQVTLRNGVISAAFLWFGFVITTMLVNNAFPGRRYLLTLIDGGHWLAAMLVMGAIVGGWGV